MADEPGGAATGTERTTKSFENVLQELQEIQKTWIRNFSQFLGNAVLAVEQGNLNPETWLGANVDLEIQTLRASLDGTAALGSLSRATRSKPNAGETGAPDLSRRVGAAYVVLAERGIRRTASYLGGIQSLTQNWSLEPRLWLGNVQNFWLGTIDDAGDWVRIVAGMEEPSNLPSESDLPICDLVVPEGCPVAEIPFEVPPFIFEKLATDQINLTTEGFWLGDRRVLFPDSHIALVPVPVNRDQRRCTLHLRDMDRILVAGMRLRCRVDASPTQTSSAGGSIKRPVACLRIEVF